MSEASSFKLGTMVELRNSYAEVYPRSPAGARGWIRARRELPQSDPEIFMEWDKTHWRYQGEPDGWTFEHHFSAIDPENPDVPDAIGADTLDLPNMLLGRAPSAPEVCEGCGEVHEDEEEPSEEDIAEMFMETLLDAQESAANAEAYLIVTVAPRKEGELTFYEPQIYASSLNPVTEDMVNTQVLHIAMTLFEEQIMERMNNLGK